MTIKIAQLSCGTEYSSVQYEIEKAARSVGAKMVYPDVSAADIDDAVRRFGFNPRSPQLKLMIARAAALADEKYDADAVFICTCFRCAEAALVRNELRRFVQEQTRLPVVTYSFTERLKASQLLTRMEALVTIVSRKEILARERQSGLTAGLDSGSSTTKAVIMQDNKIIGKDWTPSGDVVASATQVLENAMKMAGVELKDIEAIGTTGYGRFTLGDHFNAKLVQEELTVNSKGAVWLADRQKGEATILDIGGMDNKAITVRDGVPDNFTMGGICAGASGRFLEMTARRLKIDVTELGALADNGDWQNAKMNSYCSVFGIQDLVTTLGEGKSFEDVAAAACHSVAEQVYEQQLQEIDVRHPIIEVGGTSLISGLVTQVGEVLGERPIVPPDSQYIGAVGGALLSSGFLRGRHGRGGRERRALRERRVFEAVRRDHGRPGQGRPDREGQDLPEAGRAAVRVLDKAEVRPDAQERRRRGQRQGGGQGRPRDDHGRALRPADPGQALRQVREAGGGPADEVRPRGGRRRRGRGRRHPGVHRRGGHQGDNGGPVEGDARGHQEPQDTDERRHNNGGRHGGGAPPGDARGGAQGARRDGGFRGCSRS